MFFNEEGDPLPRPSDKTSCIMIMISRPKGRIRIVDIHGLVEPRPV